jgi:hypothetical protein
MRVDGGVEAIVLSVKEISVLKRMMFLVAVASSSIVFSGCWGSFQSNVWRGFGESIGAVPAGFLINFLGTTFGINFTGTA